MGESLIVICVYYCSVDFGVIYHTSVKYRVVIAVHSNSRMLCSLR